MDISDVARLGALEIVRKRRMECVDIEAGILEIGQLRMVHLVRVAFVPVALVQYGCGLHREEIVFGFSIAEFAVSRPAIVHHLMRNSKPCPDVSWISPDYEALSQRHKSGQRSTVAGRHRKVYQDVFRGNGAAQAIRTGGLAAPLAALVPVHQDVYVCNLDRVVGNCYVYVLAPDGGAANGPERAGIAGQTGYNRFRPNGSDNRVGRWCDKSCVAVLEAFILIVGVRVEHRTRSGITFRLRIDHRSKE